MFGDFEGDVCLSFHYTLFGKDMGNLRLHAIYQDSTTKLFVEGKYSYPEWQKANINVKIVKGMKVV